MNNDFTLHLFMELSILVDSILKINIENKIRVMFHFPGQTLRGKLYL
jgi:hypothetical protein